MSRPPRPRIPRQRTIDLLSDPVEPDPNRELVDITLSDQEEDHEGDMIDLDDFEGWSQGPTLVSSPMPESGRSAQNTVPKSESGLDGIDDEDKDEDDDEDDVMDFEDYDDFSTTKTSSDQFVRYSHEPDTPPTQSTAVMGNVARDFTVGLSLGVDWNGEPEKGPERVGSEAEQEFSASMADAENMNLHSNHQHSDVPELEDGHAKRQRSLDSDSTVRAPTVICSSSEDVRAVDHLAEERRNDFDVDDEPMVEFNKSLADGSRVTGSSRGRQTDVDYDSDDEATSQFIEDTADSTSLWVTIAHPRPSRNSTSNSLQPHNGSIRDIVTSPDDGVHSTEARSSRYSITEQVEDLERRRNVKPVRASGISQKLNCPYQGATCAEEKERVLAIFLRHTVPLFATNLHISHANFFTPNPPIPHDLWVRVFTPHEASRLFEVRNHELYVSAMARTKSLLEEWRISIGFPCIPEAYKVKKKIVSYTHTSSDHEQSLARDLLCNRTMRTETWMRRIFDLEENEVEVDDDMYNAMVENVLKMVAEIYQYPIGIAVEHKRVKDARNDMCTMVVDELGVLLQRLSLV